jgi:hypothetical protein
MEVHLEIPDIELPIMEERSSERGISLPSHEDVDEVLQRSRTTGCDDGNFDGISHRPRQLHIEAFLGSIAIDAREENLPCSQSGSLARPCDRIASGAGAPAFDDDFPSAAFFSPPRINRQYDALTAEFAGRARQEARVAHGSAVHRDLIAAGAQQIPDILDFPHPPTHGERDREFGSHGAHDIKYGAAPLDRCRDIEKDEFIGSPRLIRTRQGNGIARIRYVEETHTLDDAPRFDVEARYDAAHEHYGDVPLRAATITL